jgi:hypothetical protein
MIVYTSKSVEAAQLVPFDEVLEGDVRIVWEVKVGRLRKSFFNVREG